MNNSNRFQNENLFLSNFYDEVLIACSACNKMAVAILNTQNSTARIFCKSCDFNKEQSIMMNDSAKFTMPANIFFKATFSLQASFKNEVFSA